MNRLWLFFCSISVAVVAVSACTTDNITDPATVAGGAGSVSLLVVSEINGSEDIGSGTFSTSYRVDVRDSLGQPVDDADVIFEHTLVGTVSVPWDSVTPGRYQASHADYTEGLYVLHVRRGTDSLVYALITAPDIHTILYPTTADTLQQDQAFTVTWSRTAASEIVEIETRDFGPTLSTGASADSGAYPIPASFNTRDDQRIRIWRSNSTPLISGLSGSSLKAEIRNAVEPIVVQ
jgi:hypothetical protein